MVPYTVTHIPYGISDPSKRKIRNPGIKDEVEFQKFGLQTGGEHFSMRVLVQGGGGVPMHRHAGYGEMFYPVEGETGVVGHNGTKTMMLSPERGETYAVQPGEWHRFFNPSETEPLVFDAKVAPAHQGFEKLLFIFYGLVSDGHGTPEGFPKSLYHQLMLMNMGEVSYPGWTGWIMGSIAKVVGVVGRWTGEEERLTQKYYGRPISEEERRKWKVT